MWFSIDMEWLFLCEYDSFLTCHFAICVNESFATFRYRKFNLHRNEALNSTLVPDVSTFLTDFNVTFGHLSGLDILFESPAAELIRLNVSNFVYTVRMRSEIPFITGECFYIQQSIAAEICSISRYF